MHLRRVRRVSHDHVRFDYPRIGVAEAHVLHERASQQIIRVQALHGALARRQRHQVVYCHQLDAHLQHTLDAERQRARQKEATRAGMREQHAKRTRTHSRIVGVGELDEEASAYGRHAAKCVSLLSLRASKITLSVFGIIDTLWLLTLSDRNRCMLHGTSGRFA